MEQSNYGKSLQSISLRFATPCISCPSRRVRTQDSRPATIILYIYIKLPSIVLLETRIFATRAHLLDIRHSKVFAETEFFRHRIFVVFSDQMPGKNLFLFGCFRVAEQP